MNTLNVGADKLCNIPDLLLTHGIDNFEHISGRKKGMRNLVVSNRVDIVIVFTDFVEHPVLVNIKSQLKETNIPCIYCKRSTTQLKQKLESCLSCNEYCAKTGKCMLYSSKVQ